MPEIACCLPVNTRIIIGMFVYLSFLRIDTSFNGKLEFAEPFTDLRKILVVSGRNFRYHSGARTFYHAPHHAYPKAT